MPAMGGIDLQNSPQLRTAALMDSSLRQSMQHSQAFLNQLKTILFIVMAGLLVAMAGLAPAIHVFLVVMAGQKREARLRARCPGDPRLSSATIKGRRGCPGQWHVLR